QPLGNARTPRKRTDVRPESVVAHRGTDAGPGNDPRSVLIRQGRACSLPGRRQWRSPNERGDVKKRWIAGAGALVLAGAAAVLLLRRPEAAELAGLVASGG